MHEGAELTAQLQGKLAFEQTVAKVASFTLTAVAPGSSRQMSSLSMLFLCKFCLLVLQFVVHAELSMMNQSLSVCLTFA